MSRRASRPGQAALPYRICAVLLHYPDERVLGLLDDVRAALPTIGDVPLRRHLTTFTDWLEATPPTDAATHYVELFDHAPRRSLYLTYYRHGDTRARGMALLALRRLFRDAGLEPPDGELPDYLPVLLEFASVAEEPGRRALLDCRAGLELLRREVRKAGSPYAHLVEAVLTPLPALRPRQRARLAALAEKGPPTEEVGLEPFAPPEYVSGELR